jgi:hypothetical protein
LIGLVDAKTAYTYSAVIDTREKDMAKYHYILQLVDDLKDDYHTLEMDRGYSTLDLFGTLMKRKIYAVGTIKKYKNLPSLIRNAKPFRMSKSKALRKKSGKRLMRQMNRIQLQWHRWKVQGNESCFWKANNIVPWSHVGPLLLTMFNLEVRRVRVNDVKLICSCTFYNWFDIPC